ncbi:DUF2569 family protein [Paenibacillus sp. LMG 31459]|uniref:DUF2569 family protein n=1 Tax=Paenibacillus phytohabitans TaxID=2654978 RepID=A0ABX1YQF8_9BACL|nr:DUF2569 family protein [Paenibacillus phytohabitans]
MAKAGLGIIFFVIGFILHRTYAADPNVIISIVIGGLGGIIGWATGGLIRPLHVKKAKPADDEAAAASEVVLESSDQPADESEPSGSGGWLGLFAIGIVLSLFAGVRMLYGNFSLFGSEGLKLLSDPDSSYYVASMLPSLVIETVLVCIQVVMILFILYLGLKHKKLFKYISISFIVYNILLNTIDTFMFSQVQTTLSGLIPDDTSYTDIFRSFIYAVIWIPYFLRSKRVKNTFIC